MFENDLTYGYVGVAYGEKGTVATVAQRKDKEKQILQRLSKIPCEGKQIPKTC